MSGIRQLLEKRSDGSSEGDEGTQNGINVVLSAWRSNRESAGGFLTPHSSLQIAAVWAAVRLISETIASLPLFVYQETNGVKNRARDHYLYSLLHDSPNPVNTAMEMREIMQASLLLWGNAYAQLFYDASGRITEIWPLRPEKMIEVSLINKVKYYRYQTQSGQIVTSTDNEIWHIPGLSSNGITGLSVLALARKTFGLSIDAEDFGSRFFSNDARPGVVIEHPGTLGDTAYKNLKESVSEEHEGVVNSHKPMILEEGMKLHEIGIPPGDAQFLETRKFEVIEIARWFRVQPHLIGDLERSTNNNIEQQSIEFVVYTMRPWLVRWEQSINKHLLLPSERKTYYVEHLVDGLLRGDTLSRFQAYGVGKQWGFLSTNDIRRAENMNSVSGGDVYMAPLNYTDQINLRDGALNEPQKETNLSDDVEKRLNDSVQILFRDVMSRVIKREVQDLKQLTKKTLANGSNEVKFRAAVVDFYQNHMDWVGKQIFPLFQSFRTLTGSSEQEEARFVSRFCKIYQNKALEEVDIFLRSHEIDPNGFEAFLDEWKESRIKLTIDQKGQIFIGTEES